MLVLLLRAVVSFVRDRIMGVRAAEPVRSSRPGRKPARWTVIDRDYETLRIGLEALFHNLGITGHTCRRIDDILGHTTSKIRRVSSPKILSERS